MGHKHKQVVVIRLDCTSWGNLAQVVKMLKVCCLLGYALSRMLTCEHGQVGSSAVLEVHSDWGSLGVCRLGL